jgi:DNA-binding NarL/FixJ family response regulator
MGEELAPPEDLVVYRIEMADVTLALFTYSTGAEAPAFHLTESEREVLRAVVAGQSNAQIAAERRSAPRTVANQIAAIFRKVGVTSRAQLAARWLSGR